MDEADMYFDKDDDTLVKVNIVDDNDPTQTTCAAIPQEYYDRILNGLSKLRKELDKDGNVQFVLVDTEQDETSDSLNTLNKVINNTTNLHSMNQIEGRHMSADEPDKLAEKDEELKGEEYVISEYPSHGNYFAVIITDLHGVRVFEKVGQVGDTLMLDLCGNTISYLISGPNDDGSIRQTNVYIDQSEGDKSGDLTESQTADHQIMTEANMQPNNESKDEEYVISEEGVIINNKRQQMVTLSDRDHNVLDTKYGIEGESVKLQLTNNAIEYAIQGPMDSDEPIITTFIINNDHSDDMAGDLEEQEGMGVESRAQIAEDPATHWCPSDLSQEQYTAIRECARQIAPSLESGKDLPTMQPYSEALGSMAAYQDLVSLVERYKSKAEERLTDFQLLRRHSKLYMSVKPNARKLTLMERAKNEAAAQICRYIPALLFLKKRLYDCVLVVMDRCGINFRETGGAARATATAAAIPDDTLVTSDEPMGQDTSSTQHSSGVTSRTYHHSAVTAQVTAANSTVNVTSYSASDMAHSNFNQGFFGKHDYQQLSINEENAVKLCAERLQEELYQYPIMVTVDSHIGDELAGLESALNSGNASDVERAHEYMREMSAINGRLLPSQRGRTLMLSQYDMAVNEAAYHLVKNNIGLLSHAKILADLAKKVVRLSGCNFRHNTINDKKEYSTANPWLYNQDTVSTELDLSQAVKVLSDPLEDGPIESMFVPGIEETRVVADPDEDKHATESSEDELPVYRPREFRDEQVLANVHLECEAERNIVNECAIYSHTGTDNLRKVRILDFHGCSFTSIMPIDINHCYNLVELNLANNSLSYLPRCLFLPNLVKLNLRHNRFITVPLLEQFTKLQTVELDDKVARKLNNESLTYFCAELRLINTVKFEGFITDEFNTTYNDATVSMESMVQNRWEEDLAVYFKKGVTKSDSQKVIETLVISIRDRRIFNEQKFFNFKDLIARRVAENFLESKIIEDDENEEEYKEKVNEEIDSEDEDEDREISCYPKSKSQRKNEFDNQNVEKGQILLHDEPLDRLTNVVGQALRCGKTVVYSVMRTAARQPGGDLIPVGGGDNQHSSSYQFTSNSKKLAIDDCTSAANGDEKDGMDTNKDTIVIRPGPASFKKRKYGIEENDEELDVQRLIDGVMEKMESYHAIVKRRVGRPKANMPGETPVKVRPVLKESAESSKKRMFKVPKSLQGDSVNENSLLDSSKRERPLSKKVMYQIDDIIDSCQEPISTVRLRQMLGIPTRGRSSQYIILASKRSYAKHNQEMPESAIKEYSKHGDSSLVAFYDYENFSNSTPAKKLRTGMDEECMDIEDENDKDYGSELDGKRSNLINNLINEISKTNEAKKSKVEKAKPAKKPTETIVKMPLSNVFNTDRQSSTIDCKVPDYDPLHFIRCHAMDNNPNDCTTKVWRCAFEPNLKNPYMETTSIVATCGGECVCLIDCRTGKVVKRFKSRDEEFYTVAWTTLELSHGHYINILAAAGKSKDIRLLHREQLVCYAEMTGHEHEVACMSFHPRYPTVLFSGDTLANILVWDIGVPSAQDYTTKYQLLSRLICPRAHLNPVLNLVVMASHDVLVAGCEDGVFVWQFAEFKREPTVPRLPDFEVKVPTHQEPCFDGLARLSENTMLVKCVEEGEIFTINIQQIMQHFYAQKYDDQHRIVADVIGWLRWQITDEIYINVSGQMNRSTVVCGDNEGTIWLYDMTKEVREESGTKKFKTKPAKILDWPECSVESGGAGTSVKNPVVNCVEMSSDGTYLVAVTDNNLIMQHFKAQKFDDQHRIVADVIGWLRWQITDEIYINVSGQMNRSTVVCGDNEGTIWLYDMTKEVREESGTKKFKTKPAKILDWPECSVESGGAGTSVKNPVVNCVEMSSDGTYLVAVTDNNLVCIWSLTAPDVGGARV